MSSERYLEFDSTFRDRSLYPLPSDFVIQISQSGQGGKLTAKGPISDASPVLVWHSTFVEGLTGFSSYTGITASPVATISSMGNSTFQIVSPTGLRQVRNFYVGSAFSTTTGTYTVRRVVEYLPLNQTSAMVTVDSAIPDAILGLTGVFGFFNPTPLATDTPEPVVTKVYIPGSNDNLEANMRTQTHGLGGDNFYIGYTLHNIDTNTSRLITSFDHITRLATIESPTPTGENWAFTGTYNFAIRKQLPAQTGAIDHIVVAENRSIIQLSTGASSVYNLYAGDFIRIAPNTGDLPPYQPPLTEEKRIAQYVTGNGTIASALNTSSFILGSTASSTDGYYTGGILTDSNLNETSRVVSYTGATKGITVSPAFSAPSAGDEWYMRSAILSTPFSAAIATGMKYEIESYSRDGVNPFNYSGSLVSSQQEICYEVELNNLTLPNSLLKSGRGGRPVFYPFFYVMLEQVSGSSGGNKGVIYSNNPSAYKMLFRAILSDTSNPVSSPFIKIDSHGMNHIIKFRPNDSFRFGVFHSNGEPVQTVIEDTESPTEPNPLAQINACFSFRRI